ncbi:stage III sporulation protein AE [Geochorda subterranea]|uniref:Stage III sporulation protein AE n=1 Tax=Geochorda subterranea TaxID=3109564 RepID=A0ABZ1BKW2_9FIRM|nr:stage III sporulation protein AE [Limnochorda sp. LNt]WRP13464.1 stage III sporulation protein AE [Limnochorda sp. LNt]
MSRVAMVWAVVMLAAAPASGGPAAPPPLADSMELLEAVYEEGLGHVDLQGIDRLYEMVDPELRRRLEVDWGRFLRTMGREGLPSSKQLLQALAAAFVRELVLNAHLLARLLALAILGAVLHQVGRGLGGDAVVEVGRAVVLLSLVLVALGSFRVVLEAVGGSVRQMTSIAQALLPTLAGLGGLAGMGSATSVALHPVLLGVLGLSGDLLQRVVVPGLVLGATLGVAGHVATDFPLFRLSRFVQQASLVVLGLCLTVLLGVVAVRGAIGPVADSVALRTTKFIAGTTVPVVGKMVSEAVEVVAGGGALIRSGLGAAGLTMTLLVSLAPVLKLLALLFVFRLAAALLEPVGDPALTGSLGVIGDTLGLLLAGLATTVVVFLLALTAMVGASTLPWLIR